MRRWTVSERAAFLEGTRSAASLVVGIVPWGLVTGVSMVSAGLTAAQAIAMGVFVFAGSLQLAVLPLLVAKAPLWVMYATGLVVNLRYFIYSAMLAPYFKSLSRGWRILLSYLTVDGMFALFIARYPAGDASPDRHWYYFGGSLLMWSGWQAASLVGIFGGALIPRDWALEFAATLALMALLIPLLYDRAVTLGAIVAGTVAVPAARLPMNLGVVVAVAVGVTVGLAAHNAKIRPAGQETTGAH